MNLFFIRHGESTNNKLNLSDSDAAYAESRDPDPVLTPQGIAGGRHCAQYLMTVLKTLGIVSGIKIWSSPMKRALQSADVLSSYLDAVDEIVVSPMIHEIGGVFVAGSRQQSTLSGATAAELSELERVNPNNRPTMPPINVEQLPTVGGWWSRERERYSDAVERANRFVATLKREASAVPPDQVVIIICHGLFLDLIWKSLLQINRPPASLSFVTHNWGLGVVHLSVSGQVTVQCINEAGHIPVESRIAHKIKNQHITLF